MPIETTVHRDTLQDGFLVAVAAASTLPSALFPGHLFLQSEELFLVFAAATGALLSAIHTKGVTWQEKATVMLSGMGFSVFVVSAVCEYFQVVSLLPFGAAMFVGGLAGNYAIAKFLVWAKNTKFADLLQMVVETYTKRRGDK